MANSEGSTRRSGGGVWAFLVSLLCLAVLGGFIYLARLKLDAASADLARADSAQAALQAQVLELEAERDANAVRAEALAAENQSLRDTRESLAADLMQKDTELQALRATYDSFAEKMKAEIKQGEIELSESAGRIQVDLVDKVLFDSGEAEISARGREVLARVAAVLATVEDRRIQVSGHTDNSKISEKLAQTYPTNWELSAARAVNVSRFLIEEGKVPPSRVVAAGYGEFQPVASNKTPKGRARNRRIEILLTPDLDAKKAPVKVVRQQK